MLNVTSQVTIMVYDGSSNPNLLSYNIINLIPGHKYGFTVVAFNFNGKGESSEVVYFSSCTGPYGQPDPVVFVTNST